MEISKEQEKQMQELISVMSEKYAISRELITHAFSENAKGNHNPENFKKATDADNDHKKAVEAFQDYLKKLFK